MNQFSFSPTAASSVSSANVLMSSQLNAAQEPQQAEHVEANSKLRVQLEAASKEIAQLKHEREGVNAHHVNTEYALAETLAALVVAQRTVREAEEALATHLAAHRLEIDQLQRTIKSQALRAANTTLVDRAIFSLFVEMRHMLAERGECPPLSAEDVEELRCLPILGVVAELRLWARHLVALTQDASSAAFRRQAFADMSIRLTDRKSAGPSTQRGAGLSIETSLPVRSPTSKSGNARVCSPRSFMDSPRRQTMSASIDEPCTIGEKTSEAPSKVAPSPSFTLQRSASSVKGMIRTQSNLGDPHIAAQLREALSEVQSLKERLREQAKDQGLRVQLEHANKELRSQLEAAVAKARVAEQDSDNAIEAVKRHFATVVRQLNEKVARLEEVEERRRDNSQAIAAAQQEARMAKAQLARSNVKAHEEKCRRVEALLHQRDRELHETRATKSQLESSLRSLQAGHDKILVEYNAIFRKHLDAQVARQKEAQEADAKRTEQATVGPESGVTVQYLRTRYQEVLTELHHAQKKIRRMIMLSHHDQLTFSLQQQYLEQQLKAEQDEVAILSRRAEDIRSRFDHHDDDDFGGVSFEAYKAQLQQLKVLEQPPEESSVIERGNQTIISEDGFVVESTTELVSAGGECAFASPLESSMLARVRSIKRAHGQRAGSAAAGGGAEVSLRTAAVVSEPSLSQEQTVDVFQVKPQPVLGKRTVKVASAHTASPAGAMLGRPGSAAARGRPASMTPIPRPGSALL
jgi:hypothetical protein